MSGTPNLLVHETSPYLLQHAYNPVQWYPWGKEALSRAVAEDKPILVSIGYAACHWCHVMERESFEDDATAQFMNAHFINIKIDREERPDLDHIYMDAVQAMTGSGGWPLNVFLTPAAKPFYGGTYFPPVKAFNRASWMDVMQGVVQAFTQKRHEIDAQAENLTDHLVQSNAFGLQKGAAAEGLYSKEKMKEAVDAVLKTADTVWGGFGKAPKFPQTATIQFLLRYHYTVALDTEKAASGEAALAQALLSLDKMIEGGIYDQAGGGFSRYATDTEWLAPHFEKMLYDNALLVGVLSEAYQLTGKQRYKEVIDETMAFVQREMQHPQKGFYAALDADSEGVEGKFYTWSLEEVQELLGEDAAVFCHYYDVTEKGNWEHSNILRVKKTPEVFAAAHGVGIEPLLEIIAAGRKKLMARRNERIRPQLDDKILLGWNALMNAACSKAFAATGREAYRQLAIENMQFLLDTFSLPGGEGLYHTWKNGQARYPAFLDDYAFLIQALLQLQEITADHAWLEKARELTRFVTENFSEQETGFFFYTAEGQEDIIVRKKEVYDGATPSGNAVMAGNLYRLGVLYDQAEWKERASGMLLSLGQAILRYPTSFGCWISLALELTVGTAEIAVVGKNYQSLYEEIISRYIPHRVLMGAGQEEKEYPLLVGKSVNSPALVYLCKDYACLQPVNSAEALITLIDSSRKA